jgi:hypothetical protein
MNRYTYLFLFIFSIIFINAGSKPLPERTVFSVLDTDNSYELRASFHKEKSEALKKAINNSIQPERLFGQSINQYDADITLNDGTRFHLKISETRIVIKFNKKINKETAYERMKIIFAAAKKALNGSE